MNIQPQVDNPFVQTVMLVCIYTNYESTQHDVRHEGDIVAAAEPRTIILSIIILSSGYLCGEL